MITPRLWQKEGVRVFGSWYSARLSGDSRTFTGVISGGAGKTIYGVLSAQHLMDTHGYRNAVVICPNNTIVRQWLDAFVLAGIHAVQWDSANLPAHGSTIVTTYAMLSFNHARLSAYITDRTLVICDEFHHLADSQMWGVAARKAMKNVGARLMLTATAFREDEAKIPFVQYEDGLLDAQYCYGYGDALQDGYVRPVQFMALNGQMHWSLNEVEQRGRFDNKSMASHRLATALDPNGQYLTTLLTQAHSQLLTVRRNTPDAQGIIACRDQNHARDVQHLMQHITDTDPVIAISDDADSDERIDTFRRSSDLWLIVVRKGGEGMDNPRLRVGVWATNIRTQLAFIQFVYRLVRSGKADGASYLYMPAESSLMQYARDIQQMRMHALGEVPPPRVSVKAQAPSAEQQVYESLHSKAGETITIGDLPTSNLERIELLIRIRELAAGAIDDYILQESDVGVSAALYDIQRLVSVDVSQADPVQDMPRVADYERQRQWRVFQSLFNEATSKDWYADVLSHLWYQAGGEPVAASDLAHALQMSESRFTSKRKRDLGALQQAGLLEWDTLGGEVFIFLRVNETLDSLTPDLPKAALVEKLITQTLGDIP